jgi:hypothetical protein
MPLIPYARTPLSKFYGDAAASSNEELAAQGEAMLCLLPGLEEICVPFQVGGLTSHNNLCLLAADDRTSRPWPDAVGGGSTENVSQAPDMVRVAMSRSGGWR